MELWVNFDHRATTNIEWMLWQVGDRCNMGGVASRRGRSLIALPNRLRQRGDGPRRFRPQAGRDQHIQ